MRGLGMRLIWSVMTIKSPTRNEVLIPPEALETNKHADTQLLHDAHGKGDLLHGITLVKMEPALHGDDAPPLEQAENHPPLVSLDRRDGKTGNLLVIERKPSVDLLGEIPEPGTQNNPCLGLETGSLLPDPSGCLFNFLEHLLLTFGENPLPNPL